jgi:hypothetical protein
MRAGMRGSVRHVHSPPQSVRDHYISSRGLRLAQHLVAQGANDAPADVPCQERNGHDFTTAGRGLWNGEEVPVKWAGGGVGG